MGSEGLKGYPFLLPAARLANSARKMEISAPGGLSVRLKLAGAEVVKGLLNGVARLDGTRRLRGRAETYEVLI